MEFKEIKKDDIKLIEEIVNIEEEVFGKNGGADYWLVKAFVRYGLLFALMVDGEIASLAEYIQVFEKKELFLYGFLTREKFRKRGYAKHLIDYSEKRGKELGMKAILLTVDPKNEIGVNLYKKKGYEIVEFQKDEYGKGIDRYLMRKNI